MYTRRGYGALAVVGLCPPPGLPSRHNGGATVLTSVLTDVSAATVTCTLRLHLYLESNLHLRVRTIKVPVLLKCHLKLINVTGSE